MADVETALGRLKKLEAHLRSLDSGSGEAADLAKLLALVEAAEALDRNDLMTFVALNEALTALNTP